MADDFLSKIACNITGFFCETPNIEEVDPATEPVVAENNGTDYKKITAEDMWVGVDCSNIAELMETHGKNNGVDEIVVDSGEFQFLIAGTGLHIEDNPKLPKLGDAVAFHAGSAMISGTVTYVERDDFTGAEEHIRPEYYSAYMFSQAKLASMGY